MAGAGYKLFATGDVLTAAQVNTYLNEQTVMVFADSAARTTALSGVLAEGMVSYLQDTNAVEVYNGSSWVNVGNAGDITEVQAGTGISVASGTGPIPVVTNTMATAIDAAGDLIYGTGADTFARLGIGTAGQVLKVNSGATAPEWGTVGGGGKVLQVVSATYSTATSSTSETYADTGLSASITPSSASSKVLILTSQQLYVVRSSDEVGGCIRIMRGATSIYDPFGNRGAPFQLVYTSTQNGAAGIISYSYLDSPATTSATTYKTQLRVKNAANSSTATVQENSSPSSIILLEIGA